MVGLRWILVAISGCLWVPNAFGQEESTSSEAAVAEPPVWLESEAEALSPPRGTTPPLKGESGAFFRIKLMLSAEFIEEFGPPDEQRQIVLKIAERISLRDEKIVELAGGVTSDTSEEQAQLILAKVKKVAQKRLRAAEDDLVALLPQSTYREILEVQLGLVGMLALQDEIQREFLQLNEEQSEKCLQLLADFKSDVRSSPQLRPSAEAKCQAAISKLLTTAQRKQIQEAGEVAAKFRERQINAVAELQGELPMDLDALKPDAKRIQIVN